MTPSRIGPYPIEHEVGRGGMGVVYRARDTRLDRAVAIKVLPDLFAGDPERLARFEREARLLAALTHPNIAGIYGLEESEGRRFLVLEFVEGETLADRLRRGALPLEETVEVARQVASALEAAHEAGIVHRDLKPGNVKLTPQGAVKVLDFGLAKSAAGGADSAPDLSQSPTLTQAATGAGVILGTAAYMSPEQARGKPVDRRTDIWSFGCLLYECLTGAQAFEGETTSDLIAMILQGQPDWSRLPAKTPEKLRLLLHRCLERDARQRLRDVGDARIELEELMGSRVSSASRMAPASASPPGARRFPWAPAVVALVIIAALAGATAFLWPRPDSTGLPYRFIVHPPARAPLVPDANELAISPDGRSLAFVATDSTGQTHLWVRPLGDFTARMLPGTRGASLPFWAPDSRRLGFFAEGKLKRIRITGGQPEPICDAVSGRGGAWNREDIIVFGGAPTGPLFQVRASGGMPAAVTVLDTTRGETAHRFPCFLPDGRHFTYAALPARAGRFTCYVGSLRGTSRQTLLEANGAPVYAAPGHLIFWLNEALQAQRFDPAKRRVTGDPFTIAEPPISTNFTGAPAVSVSANGVLAWQAAGNLDTRLVWLDRGGRPIGAVDVPADRWELPFLSDDDRYAVVSKGEPGGARGLWVVDLLRGVSNRISSPRELPLAASWSPDGKEVIYSASRDGPRDLFRRAADGATPEEPFYRSAFPFKDPMDWLPEGGVIIQENGGENGWDLVLVPESGGAPVPLVATRANEQFGSVSPDGRWLLYTSDETGSPQSFVQSFPKPGRRSQVSRTGSFFGRWTAGGREIILLRGDLSVASIPVSGTEELTFGPARELFRLPQNSGGFAPTADGQRFLVTVPAEQSIPGISIAVNWRAVKE